MFLLVISIVIFPLNLGKSGLTLCHSRQLFLFISLALATSLKFNHLCEVSHFLASEFDN